MLRHIPCGSSWLCYHFSRFIRVVPCFWRGRYCKFILAQRGIYVYSAYMHCTVLWRCRYCEFIWPSEEYMKPSVNSNWSYSPETVNSGQNWRFLLLQFDRWPKKNIRHLFYTTSKLCATFHGHRSIQPGVTVRKRLFGSESVIFLP